MTAIKTINNLTAIVERLTDLNEIGAASQLGKGLDTLALAITAGDKMKQGFDTYCDLTSIVDILREQGEDDYADTLAAGLDSIAKEFV